MLNSYCVEKALTYYLHGGSIRACNKKFWAYSDAENNLPCGLREVAFCALFLFTP